MNGIWVIACDASFGLEGPIFLLSRIRTPYLSWSFSARVSVIPRNARAPSVDHDRVIWHLWKKGDDGGIGALKVKDHLFIPCRGTTVRSA